MLRRYVSFRSDRLEVKLSVELLNQLRQVEVQILDPDLCFLDHQSSWFQTRAILLSYILKDSYVSVRFESKCVP